MGDVTPPCEMCENGERCIHCWQVEVERLRELIADYFNARTTFDLSDPDERRDAADLLADAEGALRDG